MIGLRFTDGTTTVTISDLVNGILTGYQAGGEGSATETTTDKVFSRLRGSRATKLANMQALNRLLGQARERQQKPFLARVFVERDTGDGTWWRSEVTDGALLLGADGLHQLEMAPEVAVAFERKNYWEGGEAQLPLSNGNGTNDLDGLVVFNCNDGTGISPGVRHNYAQIGVGVVEGDLATPARIEMTNQYNSAARLSSVWVGHNAEADPVNFQHILEGEAVSYGGTNSANAAYSGGYARNFAWAGDYQQLIGRWALDTTYLTRAGGKWFKILGMFTSAPSAGTRVQVKIMFPSGTPLTMLASSQEVTLGAVNLQDLGMLQIPPWLVGVENQSGLDLCLYARRTGGGSLGLDFVQVTPVDSYRVLTPQGYGAAYQVRIVDDGVSDTLYTDGWAGGGKTGHYVGVGAAVLLKPGKLQRLMFLQSGDTGDTLAARTLSVKAFYRPRRLTL